MANKTQKRQSEGALLLAATLQIEIKDIGSSLLTDPDFGQPPGNSVRRLSERMSQAAVAGFGDDQNPEPLLRRSLAGSLWHHGRVQHSLRRVVEGDDAIAINHAVVADHVAPIPGGKAESDYRSGKAHF